MIKFNFKINTVFFLVACLICSFIFSSCGLILEIHLRRYRRPNMRTGLTDVSTKLSFDGHSDSLKATKITSVLESPIVKGENLIWCASFQSLWKELQNEILNEPVELDKSNTFVLSLNKAENPADFIPNQSFFTIAGLITDDFLKNIKNDFQSKFPEKKVPTFNSAAGQYLIYSYLATNIKFELPYFQNRKPLIFIDSKGRKTKINSFGIREEDDGAFEKLRGQPAIIYQKIKKENYTWTLEEFAIDLDRDSDPNQIIIGIIERPKTLKSIVLKLEEELKKASQMTYIPSIGIHNEMLIPEIFFNISHNFEEIEGAKFLNKKLENLIITSAQQDIKFKLDRNGAELEAESKMRYASASFNRIIDKPFFVYMKKRNNTYPYFVMWIDNAELLNKFRKIKKKK